MKYLLTGFLLMAIIGQASVRTVWVLHYHYNRTLYLKNCENKSKPELKCDGKCYLKKKMAPQPDNKAGEPRLPESFSQIKDLQLFFHTGLELSLQTAASYNVKSVFPPYLTCLTSLPESSPFKPPARCAVLFT